MTGYAIDRVATYETSRRFRAERTVEQLGVLFGDGAYPTWKPTTGRDIRRSVIHDRLAASGAHFNSSMGWEFAEWFADEGEHPATTMDFARQESFPIVAREHRAVREAVGVLDMSLMAKILVQGPDAAAVLSRLSANDVTREVGRVVYTQWLATTGGIVADVTVTRLADEVFLVVASDLIHRRIEPHVRRATRDGEVVVVTDVTSASTLLSVQGPASRELLGPLTDADLSNDAFPYLTAQGHPRRLRPGPRRSGDLRRRARLRAARPDRVRPRGLRRPDGGGPDLGIRNVGLSAMSSLRLEKGYRDLGVDIDNTDTPLEAGLGFAVAWDKPGGFIGRDALLAAREEGPPKLRVVSLFVDDPELDLFGNEPVLLDGEWVGYVRAAAFGHTLGGPVGLAEVSCADGVTAGWLKAAGDFTVRTPHREVPAQLQLGPSVRPRPLADPGALTVAATTLSRGPRRRSLTTPSPEPCAMDGSAAPVSTEPELGPFRWRRRGVRRRSAAGRRRRAPRPSCPRWSRRRSVPARRRTTGRRLRRRVGEARRCGGRVVATRHVDRGAGSRGEHEPGAGEQRRGAVGAAPG